jgi:hypothetical protein
MTKCYFFLLLIYYTIVFVAYIKLMPILSFLLEQIFLINWNIGVIPVPPAIRPILLILFSIVLLASSSLISNKILLYMEETVFLVHNVAIGSCKFDCLSFLQIVEEVTKHTIIRVIKQGFIRIVNFYQEIYEAFICV